MRRKSLPRCTFCDIEIDILLKRKIETTFTQYLVKAAGDIPADGVIGSKLTTWRESIWESADRELYLCPNCNSIVANSEWYAANFLLTGEVQGIAKECKHDSS
jgi:hypothetical protein